MTWAYLAGFFDGEGHVGMDRNRGYGYSPRIVLPQSGERGRKVLEKIAVFLVQQGLRSPAISVSPPVKLSKLPIWRLYISSRHEATLFLRGILPYLQVKHIEAQDMLRHMQVFPALPKGGWRSWEGRRLKQVQ